jgi:diguanylate cyclase (GGDEF)-like protein/PAS domain S-box-containing protein
MGLATCSWDGHLLEVNRTFGEILGRDPASLVGSSFAALTMGEDRGGERELIEQLRSGTVDRFSVETRLVHAEGRVVWVAVTVSSVHDADGGPGYMIGMIEDITERRALREQMAFAAVHDQLTGLPNRTHFMDRLDRTLRRAQLDRRSVALLFLDLDRFKLVNDGLGHEAGDRLLQRVAQRLQHAVRPTDLLARFGGDEFTVLCEAGTEAEARDVADRLQRAMRRPVGEDDHEQFVTLSIGIALSSPATVSGAELLQRADVAMYRAKEQGPSRVAVYCADDELATVRNLRTSNELHRALDRDEFVLHYQPFVDLTDLRTVGCEALVRWRHPTRGLLGPGEFIPQAESSGLIVPLGTWVLREACRQGAEWTARRERDGLDTGRCNVSVNVAPLQLADPDFPAVVEAAVAEAGFCADQLWLEITEGAILRDPAAAVEVLGELRAIGTHLSIDDFGTGYSSLSYLKQLPVEILKIDRSFVAQIEEDLDDMAIVRAVLALGDSLGLAVIAEGIERPGQADQLTALGCHFAQGFLYGRPLPAEVLGSYPADDLGAWSTEGEALGA